MLSKEELVNLAQTDIESFNTEIRNANGSVDLSETDFSGANIEGAEFINVDLTSSSFADSHLTEVKFDGCDLTSVDFTRASIIECSFNESVLNGTDFSYSKTDYCNFSDADLAGAIFQGADLTNSDFSAAENFNACRFDEETIWPDICRKILIQTMLLTYLHFKMKMIINNQIIKSSRFLFSELRVLYCILEDSFLSCSLISYLLQLIFTYSSSMPISLKPFSLYFDTTSIGPSMTAESLINFIFNSSASLNI